MLFWLWMIFVVLWSSFLVFGQVTSTQTSRCLWIICHFVCRGTQITLYWLGSWWDTSFGMIFQDLFEASMWTCWFLCTFLFRYVTLSDSNALSHNQNYLIKTHAVSRESIARTTIMQSRGLKCDKDREHDLTMFRRCPMHQGICQILCFSSNYFRTEVYEEPNHKTKWSLFDGFCGSLMIWTTRTREAEITSRHTRKFHHLTNWKPQERSLSDLSSRETFTRDWIRIVFAMLQMITWNVSNETWLLTINAMFSLQ